MAGKFDPIADALRAAMRVLSERDAMALSRTGSDPKRFLPYTGSFHKKNSPSFYDPKYWDVKPDNLEYPEGVIVGTRDKLVPVIPSKTASSLIKPDNEIMYRGMSADEMASFLRNQELKSRGDYNLTGQEGLTYFTKDPEAAEYYANAFAPEKYKPDMEKPAYLVAAKRPPSSRIVDVPGTASHELGVTGPVPVEDVVGVYRGTTTDYTPVWREGGSYQAPSASLDWEEKSLDDILRGRASGGRTGYGPGGIIDDALKAAGKAMGVSGDDAAEAAIRQSMDIPAQMRPGFTVQAAPSADDETRQLVDYLNQRDPNLAFDPKSLAERREDLGMMVPGYHGSPRNFDRFSNQYSNPEGYWGGHHYVTSSPVDASFNYATPTGPDLTNRLQQTAEGVLDNFHPDDVVNWHKRKYGTAEGVDPVNPQIVKEFSDDMAREELGITNEGAVYPVNLRMKNPVRIDSPNQTFWDYSAKFNDDGDITEEGGKAIDLLRETQGALDDYGVHEAEASTIMGRLADAMNEQGGIDAKTYNDIMRGSNSYPYDADGNLVSMGHLMADVFRRIGHDSIDMPTDVFAGARGRPGMVGTGGDTRHYIIFEPKNIRSRFGAYDPFRAASDRISEADGGAIEGALRTAGRKGYAGRGRVLDDALAFMKRELDRLKTGQMDDTTAILRGDELLKKSRNFEQGVPLLGNEKYGTPLDEMSAQYDDVRKMKDYLVP